MIYGPYGDDGQLDCSGFDACHGKVIDGNYAYVWEISFPYNVGCFGTSDTTSFTPSCSTNTVCEEPGGGSDGGSAQKQALSGVQVNLLVFFAMIAMVINAW